MVGVSITSLDGSVCAQNYCNRSAPCSPNAPRAAGLRMVHPYLGLPATGRVVSSRIRSMQSPTLVNLHRLSLPFLSLSLELEVRVLDGGNSQH